MNQIKYTADKPFVVENEVSVVELIRYFNSFHDGFIKHIMLESNDYFGQDDENDIMSRHQVVTSEVNLRIDIAHYNYGVGYPPINRYVCLAFTEFYDLKLNVDVSNKTEWTIDDIKMKKVSRPLDTDPQFSMQLFEFILERSIYDPSNGWSHVAESLFKFLKALVWEEDR